MFGSQVVCGTDVELAPAGKLLLGAAYAAFQVLITCAGTPVLLKSRDLGGSGPAHAIPSPRLHG